GGGEDRSRHPSAAQQQGHADPEGKRDEEIPELLEDPQRAVEPRRQVVDVPEHALLGTSDGAAAGYGAADDDDSQAGGGEEEVVPPGRGQRLRPRRAPAATGTRPSRA